MNWFDEYVIQSLCKPLHPITSCFNSHATKRFCRTDDPLNRHFCLKSAFLTYLTTLHRENVWRDSIWNLILHILMISARTGSWFLKTVYTGRKTWKLEFGLILLDFEQYRIAHHSSIVLSRVIFEKSIPLFLQDQIEFIGVNFSVAWLLKVLKLLKIEL